MTKGKLFNFSIMPLDTEHLEEMCVDIRNQYESGVTDCALFCMTLTPEDNPPINKAEILCQKYDLFKQKLDVMGVPNGVLVQATIGHGWVLSRMFPYQRYTALSNGTESHVVCPLDDGFQEYIYNNLRIITQHNPDHIMIDDDLRLIFRDGGGCLCPLHLKRFNELAGTNFACEELRDYLCKENERYEEYSKIFIETQREAVVKTAKTIRAAIDSVNPKMQSSFCCVSNNVEFARDIAPIIAGKDNPVIVRINNGNYLSAGPRFIGNVFYRAATQIAKLKDIADIILAETDTFPQNRYSTGAMSLHSHFTGSILEGAMGAKQWITRLNSFEPQSGLAYRRILSKNRGFYEKLAEIVPTLKWRGCRIPVMTEPRLMIGNGWCDESGNSWADCILDRLGLPIYFSNENGGVLCLEGDSDSRFSDEEIFEALKQNVILCSDSAKRLIDRGFGEYLGVDVGEWKGKQPSTEKLFVNGNSTKIQANIKELIINNDKASADSIVYHTVDDVHYEELFAGTVIFENSLSGKVFIFCGAPKNVTTAVDTFSFLNYSRKQQLIKMLGQTGELPVYYPYDEEVYLRAADMADGGLFCAVFNIGTDPIENLTLAIDRKPLKIEKLMPDGSRKELEFTNNGNEYTLNTVCNTLDPVVLFIYA